MMIKTRNSIIDNQKFFLIVLVIFGHVSSYVIFDRNLPTVRIEGYLKHIIYAFHMPLFIFISGYFSHKYEKKRFFSATGKLLRIYLIFQIMRILINYLFFNKPIRIDSLLVPCHTLWYLLSLFFWRLFIQVIPIKVINNNKILIAGGVILSLLGGFCPAGHFLSINRTLTFSIFFIMGFIVRKKELFNKILTFKISAFHIVVLSIAIILSIKLSVFYGKNPYNHPIDICERVLQIFNAIILSIGIIRFLPKHFKAQGQNVLFFYVYHVYVLMVIGLILKFFGVQSGFITHIIITAICTYLLSLLSKIKILYIPIK